MTYTYSHPLILWIRLALISRTWAPWICHIPLTTKRSRLLLSRVDFKRQHLSHRQDVGLEAYLYGLPPSGGLQQEFIFAPQYSAAHQWENWGKRAESKSFPQRWCQTQLGPAERLSNRCKQVKGQSTVPRPHLWAPKPNIETHKAAVMAGQWRSFMLNTVSSQPTCDALNPYLLLFLCV